MSKTSTVKGHVLIRIAGETVVVGEVDVPVTISGPDEAGRATISFPKDTVRRGLKKMAKRIAETLA